MSDVSQRIFISYSSSDKEEARRILELLGAAGLGAWFDEVSIGGGKTWSLEIVEAIKKCSAMILLCTPRSVSSRNVQQEIQLAWESNRPILPLIVESSIIDPKIEYALAGRQYISVAGVSEELWVPKVLRALHDFGIELDRKILSRLSQIREIPETEIDFLPPPTNLPHAVSETIGRTKEISEIENLIFQTRLLTLTGTGGTGKTRLSADVGRELLKKFRDGVYFVALAPVVEAALVPSAIAQALDVREVQGQPLIASIKAFIYKKNVLLILDNFEHLLAGRHIVTELLQSCPNLRVLVTSRVHLGISGEHGYSIDPLELPDRSASEQEVRTAPAIQLFLQRAKEARFNFNPSVSELQIVNQICHKLDGLPLAIELAAARIKMLAPQAILSRMESWKSFLAGNAPDQPERHKTLNNAIEWSYNLLKPNEKALFNMLGVFSGGFTIETAEALANELKYEADVLDAIGVLVDSSLIRISADSTLESRYMMLETLRQFAMERLQEQGIEQEVRRAHAEVFAKVAELAEVPLFTAEIEYWNPILESETPNIRSALRWSVENNPEVGMRIIGGIGMWFFRGSVEEGRQWADELLEIDKFQEPSWARTKAIRSRGQLYWGIGDVPNALKYLSQALPLSRVINDKQLLCDVVSWNILSYMANVIEARTLFEEAQALAREINSFWHQKITCVFLAIAESTNFNIPEAIALLDRSLIQTENLPWVRGGALMIYGGLSLAIQDIDKAFTMLEESLTLLIRVRDQKNQIAVMCMLAGIAAIRNELNQSSTIHRKALLLCLQNGEQGGLYGHLCGLALLFLRQKRYSISVKLMAGADTLKRSTGATPIPMSDALTQSAPQKIEELRATMDPTEFQAAWDAGAKLSSNEAIEYACKVIDEMTF
jgi:predicted ATPase